MKKYLVILFIFFSTFGKAQELDFKNYLLVGIEQAEFLTAIYLDPLSDGLTYALTGGWYNTARVKDRWQIELSLVTNGSFVPDERLSEQIDLSQIDNLDVQGGGDIVAIPTILGSDESSVTLVTTVDGEQIEFNAPTGIGLININLLPSAFLQARMGLPLNSEVSLRYFPKISVSDISVGIFGVGIKHELSRSIEALENGPITISGMIAYTRLDTDYSFETNGFVTGENQFAEGFINTWMYELIISTEHPVYNFYGGFGYITGKADYALKGSYVIETNSAPILFQDPFDVQNSVTGWRANLGVNVRMGWFGVNLGYTFQGFNNLSMGLNFNLQKAN